MLSMYCQHTPTWAIEPLTQLGRTTKCLRHIPQLAKNKFTSMHMHNFNVCEHRQTGANTKHTSQLHTAFNPTFP